MNHYPSNLTDNQWQSYRKILDVRLRKRKYSLRSIVNAINYLLKTGCQWRILPKVVRHAKSHSGVRVGGGAPS